MPNPIIRIENLGSKFGDNWVHRNLNLTIMPNKIITIIGDSGCGKTTLIREILMLKEIAEGKIYLYDDEISSYDINKNSTKMILSQMGMMFQHGALFTSLTVIENVMFPILEYTNLTFELAHDLAASKIKMVGLNELDFNKYPKELSGGMLKRSALARTLALDPKLIFLDEPTAGLDPNSANEFDDLLLSLKSNLGFSVVMITHDLDSIWKTTDEVIYMGDKRVLFHGSLYDATNNQEVVGLNKYFNQERGNIIKEYYYKRGNKEI